MKTKLYAILAVALTSTSVFAADIQPQATPASPAANPSQQQMAADTTGMNPTTASTATGTGTTQQNPTTGTPTTGTQTTNPTAPQQTTTGTTGTTTGTDQNQQQY